MWNVESSRWKARLDEFVEIPYLESKQTLLIDFAVTVC